jgi:lysophospholipase L1-like esterase
MRSTVSAILAVFLGSVFLAGAASVAGASEMPLETVKLGGSLDGDVEIPTLGTSDGNTIYCVYSQNINSIWIQATQDGGKTWSEPVRVMGLPSPRYITDANILVDGKRLTVFATHVLESVDHPDKIAKSVFRVSVSEDGGQTWSPCEALPIQRNYVVGCIHAPVWLDGDTVVMGYSWDVPAENNRPAASEGGMFLKSGVLISNDRGRSWKPGSDVELDIHPIGADEPAVVRLGNGDLFMVIRTSQARPYETVSHDGGRTWEKPHPSVFRGHDSPTALLRLRNGMILRAWDNSPTNRFPLVVSLSADDGRTWSVPRTVTEPDVRDDGSLSYDTACYPTLAESADGTVVIAWWQRAGGKNSVHAARLSPQWLDEAKNLPARPVIVAFGDSVTRGVRPGVTERQTFRSILEQQLRKKGVHADVVDAGLGSDTTASGLARLEQDVLREKPKLVIIMFGINDAAMVDGGPVARSEPRVSLEAYRDNLRSMVTEICKSGSKVLLCTPTPMSRKYVYSDIGAYAQQNDMNFQLRNYAQAVRDLAAELKLPVLDTFRLFEQSPDRMQLIEDGCHPYVQGHAIIAEALFDPVSQALQGE